MKSFLCISFALFRLIYLRFLFLRFICLKRDLFVVNRKALQQCYFQWHFSSVFGLYFKRKVNEPLFLLIMFFFLAIESHANYDIPKTLLILSPLYRMLVAILASTCRIRILNFSSIICYVYVLECYDCVEAD